jgi:hypothetical protein
MGVRGRKLTWGGYGDWKTESGVPSIVLAVSIIG